MIPALLMDNKSQEANKREIELILFNNYKEDEPTKEALASDVVMRTISAPTYFKSFQGSFFEFLDIFFLQTFFFSERVH